MSSLPLGELAALGAAFLWAFTSILFTRAGRLASPVGVCAFRCTLAALIFSILVALRSTGASGGAPAGHDLFLLVMSGVVGLAFGDSCLFISYVLVGTRRALLLQSLAPVLGIVAGAIILGEHLAFIAYTGIAFAMIGVVWAITERRDNGDAARSLPLWATRRPRLFGTLAGMGGAVGQAGGAVLAKAALRNVDVLSATHLRMVGGAAALLLFGFISGRLRPWMQQIARYKLFRILLIGSIASQVVAVWLMVTSLDLAPTGIALTLLATIPVWILPIGWKLENDRPTGREILGILVTVAGVALLLLRSA